MNNSIYWTPIKSFTISVALPSDKNNTPKVIERKPMGNHGTILHSPAKRYL